MSEIWQKKEDVLILLAAIRRLNTDSKIKSYNFRTIASLLHDAYFVVNLVEKF